MIKCLATEGQNGILAIMCSSLGVPDSSLGLKNVCNYRGSPHFLSQTKEVR